VIFTKRTSGHPAGPRATLVSLGEGLFENEEWIAHCEPVESGAIPEAVRALLVHHRHMTATLNANFGEPVALKVLEHREDEEYYRRKILLTVDNGQRVVEFGLVRLDLQVLPDEARADVIARERPLGEIFSRYDVLTRVEPRWYLRFDARSPIVQCFGPRPPDEAFGRLGVIYCDHRPAVELLEVVAG